MPKSPEQKVMELEAKVKLLGEAEVDAGTADSYSR